MVYTLPEDPLTRGLNRAIGSASKSIGSGLQQRSANKQAQNKVTAHGQFLIKSLGIDPNSEEGQAISNAQDYESLIAIGNSISKGADNSKKEMQEQQKSLKSNYDIAAKDISGLFKDGIIAEDKYGTLMQGLRKEEKYNKNALSNGSEIRTDALDSYTDAFIKEKQPTRKEKKAAEKEAKAAEKAAKTAPKEMQEERPVSEDGKWTFDINNQEDKKQLGLFLRAAKGNEELANEMLSEIYD